jgi:FkbM family methyltransferase
MYCQKIKNDISWVILEEIMKLDRFLKKTFKAFMPYGILVVRRRLLSQRDPLGFYGNLKKNLLRNHLANTIITPPPTEFARDSIIKIVYGNYNAPIFLRNDTSDVGIYRAIIENGEYDFIVDKEPDVIIDAGANIGLSTIFFANKYPNAKIIAIEPEDSNYKLLEKNTESYGNVCLIKAALWDSIRDIYLFDTGLDKDGFMVGEMGSGKDMITPYHKERCLTKTVTIEKLIKDYSLAKIDILKMDIEGSEKEVFNNCFGWIDNVNVIIVELHERMKRGCNKSFNKIKKRFDDICKDGEDIYLIRNNYIKTEK